MVKQSEKALLKPISMYAAFTTLMGLAGAIITACLYGLLSQWGWDIVGFVLGTILLLVSLIIVTHLLAIVNLRWPNPYTLFLPIFLGIIHGYTWSTLVWYWYEPLLANFIPLAPAWIVGSICGLYATMLLPRIPSHLLWVNRGIFATSIIFLMGIFVPGLLLASCMVAFLLDNGNIHETSSNSDHSVTALSISDSCGATCSCLMRVDLQSEQRYVRNIYSSDACQVHVIWQSTTHFRIVDDNNFQQEYDIQMFGLQPQSQ